ncbi:MAG: ATP-binding protein [bacterium]
MRLKKLAEWLQSLKARMIITYLLVVTISFGILALLIMGPVRQFIMQREEDKLVATAITLGTTIREPWIFSDDAWQSDLAWTQRRCRLYLSPTINTRIRVLDAAGKTLTDSSTSLDWMHWKNYRKTLKPLATRPEVKSAIQGIYMSYTRKEENRPNGHDSFYVALPIQRHDLAGEVRVAFIMYLDKSVDELNSNLRSLINLLIAGMLGSLLITIVVSVLLAENVSARLLKATHTAEEFARGNLDVRMPATGNDEVGKLSGAFNSMADTLQRQEQLRRDLLADVSHELRTPLTAINGCADSLQDAMVDDPKAAGRFLQIIQNETARMQRLVSDILDLSRLRSGLTAVPLATVDLINLAEEAVEIARLNEDKMNVSYELINNTGDSLPVHGNEDRISQVLRNLLDNARKFSPDGGLITMKLAVIDDNAVVEITDQGQGIAKEELPYLFERFYRSGRGNTTGGAGLGLAIVREIMQAHGGRTEVDSEEGKGTTFRLYFRKS